MLQSHDHFRHELEALYGRVGRLKRRKEQKAAPPNEMVEEAFAELQTLMEELQVAEENLRQQNEELLAAAQCLDAERRRYEDLFEFAPDGYLVTDVRGVIQEANRAAVALLGRAEPDLIGQALTALMPQALPAEWDARLEELRNFPVSDSAHTWETQLSVHEKPPVDVSLTVSAIRGRMGAVTGLRWMLRDITASRQAEAQRHAAVLAERNRIAQELHDTLAQGFTGIAVQLEAAEEVLPASQERAQKHLARARSLARASLAETLRSVWGLRPHALESGDLPGALAHTLAEITSGTSLHTSFHTQGASYPLHAAVEDNLLRICQEALTNVLKHAQAQSVSVCLSFRPETVELCIVDDGNGLAVGGGRSGGFGLAGMRARAERIGAEFTLESESGEGTRVCVTLAGDQPAQTGESV